MERVPVLLILITIIASVSPPNNGFETGVLAGAVDARATASATGGAPKREERAFPEVALVGRGSHFVCSGTLVAPRTVVTAAHCLPATIVAFGDGIERTLAELPVIDSRVLVGRDVALLRLAGDAPIEPARVEPKKRDAYGGLFSIVGFGAIDPNGVVAFGTKRKRNVLRALAVPCSDADAHRSGCAPTRELLLESSGAADACAGDSGGAVFLESATLGRVLIAVTSRGVDNRRTRCGDGGIYELVDEGDVKW